MQSFLEGVGALRDKTATAVRLAATKASTPSRDQGNRSDGNRYPEMSEANSADLARRLRSKNKKIKALYTARSKENDVLREFIFGILPDAALGDKSSDSPFIPDINSLRAAFEASHGHTAQTSTESPPPNMVSGDLIREPQQDLEKKYKAVIGKFRETVGKYRLLQRRFDALREKGDTETTTKDRMESETESQTEDRENSTDDENGLVKKLEIENRQLLSRGKDLYKKHKKLKLEHETAVAKLLNVENHVNELTEVAKNHSLEIKRSQERLEIQKQATEAVEEHAKRRLEDQMSIADAAVSALEKLKSEFSTKTSEWEARLMQSQERVKKAEMAYANHNNTEGAQRNLELEHLKALLQESEVSMKDAHAERDLLQQKMKILKEQHEGDMAQAARNAEQIRNDDREAARNDLATAAEAAEAAITRQESSLNQALEESRAKTVAIEQMRLEKDAIWEAKLQAADKTVADAFAKDVARGTEIGELEASLREARVHINMITTESESLQSKMETLTEQHECAVAEAHRASKTVSEFATTKEEYENRIREIKASHAHHVAKLEARIEQHKEVLIQENVSSLEKQISEAVILSSTLKRELAESKASAAYLEEKHQEAVTVLQNKLSTAEKASVNICAKEAEKSREVERLQASLQKSENVAKKCTAETEALQKKIDALIKQHDEALRAALHVAQDSADTATMEDYENRIRDLNLSHEKHVSEEVDRWENKLAKALELKTAAEKKADALRETILDMKATHGAAVKMLQTTIENLESEIAKMQAVVNETSVTAEENIGALSKALAASKARQDDFAKKGNILVAKLKTLTEQKVAVENDLKAARETIARTEKQNLEADTLLSTMKLSLDKSKSEAVAIEEERLAASAALEAELIIARNSAVDADAKNAAKNSEIERLQCLLQESEARSEKLHASSMALRSSLEETRTSASLADKRAEEQQAKSQEAIRSGSKKLILIQGELRLAQERIDRLMTTSREKELESQERVAALQRSLEEMRQQTASVSAEQDDIESIREALKRQEAILEDVKKTDKRIIADLKREMGRIMRQSRIDKAEQTIIAEKALTRLRQEADRVSELEDLATVLRRDMRQKSNEVEVAKMQIEQLSALTVGAPAPGAAHGIMSWLSGSAPSTPSRARPHQQKLGPRK